MTDQPPNFPPEWYAQHPFQQAMRAYPAMRDMGLQYKQSPQTNDNILEYWPQGETGDTDYPRPPEFDINRPGIELYGNKASALDVLGDAVSHGLRETDPVIHKYYEDFQKSLTQKQNTMLGSQYDEARAQGETRPFTEWVETAGLPALFRGYAFKQWPEDIYTTHQKKKFDTMMQYLSTPKDTPSGIKALPKK